MKLADITKFILAALLVMIIGAFGGYYFFIKQKTEQTATESGNIGDGSNASFTGQVGSTYQNIVSDINGATSTAEVGKRAPRLWHVVLAPVAGFGFGAQGNVAFVAERATGNILRVDPATSAIFRLTNTLVPKVREALFSRSGDVILRSTDSDGAITTFAGTIATTTVVTSTSTPNVLDGTYLPQNIVSIDLPNNQPSAKGLVYVAENPDGGSVAVSSGWKGTGVKKILTSPLTQWRIQALPDGRAVMTQKADDDATGYSFIVTPSGTTKTLQSGAGLTVLYHETSDAYLYGLIEDGKPALYVKAGTSKPVKLPIATTADKCVWAPGAGLIAYCAVPTETPGQGYLRAWYEGAMHSQDVWWKVQAAEGSADRFFVPDSSARFDVENPLIDETGSLIGFRDASDKSFWMLRIAEQ